MAFFQLASVRLSFFLIVGILLGNYLNPSISLSGFLTLILFAALFLTYKLNKNGILFGGIVGLSFCALGVFIMALSNPRNNTSHYSHHPTNRDASFHLTITEVLKSTLYADRYLAKIQMMDSTLVTGKVLLRFPKDSATQALAIDDRLLVHGNLKEIKGPLNPHQFNYKRYMAQRGVYHQLFLGPKSFYRTTSSARSLLGAASRFRDFTIQQLKSQPIGKEKVAVMEAILLGQRNDLSDTTYQNYKDAGAVHILALSGLHIGILLLLLRFLLSPLSLLPYGKQLQLLITLFLLWGFALVAGLSSSIVRAVTMFSFVAYALYLKRPTHTLNVVTLSLFFLLLAKPSYLFQVGFQMSYAAVYAIVWLYPKLQALWRPSNTFIRKLWQLMAVSCTAQLGVLPISLFYFHQFPGLFFVSNVIVVPFLGVVLGLGILVLALSNFSILPVSLAHFYNGIIGVMNRTVSWIAKQDDFLFREVPFDAVSLVLSYALIFSFVFFATKGRAKIAMLVLVCTLLFQTHTFLAVRRSNSKSELILAHQTANSLMLHKQGPKLHVYQKNNLGLDYLLPNFKIAERIETVSYSQLQNSYRIGNKTLHIMDSLAVLPTKNVDYLLITQSPKVNMERVLDAATIGTVLVDGSNYRNLVAQWKVSCDKKEVPFHFTGEKGAFYFPFNKD